MNIIEEIKKLKSKAKEEKSSFIVKLVFSLGIGLLGGMLGAWGGADGTSKAWRRVGLTILYTVYGILMLRSFWALSIGLVFIPLTFGYGIPDPITYDKPDKGSNIGRFWYKVFKIYPEYKRHFRADLATRSTVALIIMTSIIIVPILKGNWGQYFLYGLAVVSTFAFLSWRGMGTFEFCGKKLGWAEMVVWSITTFSIIKIIG